MCEARGLNSWTERKRRRALAGAVAVLAAVSLVAGVPAGPVQAANTSSEELLDTNDDGIGDKREFAGSHRYNTAVALAERFAQDANRISTVIIASGETQVDAVASAGLAGYLDAPVLLTRRNQLPHNVRRYIDEHNISRVIIVGGTAVVPNAIKHTIEALNASPTVERVWGRDRYATAAAISERIGGAAPTWCGSTQRAAILVNGTETGRADAIAIGPLAYALGMPMLLTEAHWLPSATRAFLTDNKIRRVVIVGSDAAVSERIKDSLVDDLGVVSARRIAGGTSAATSVAIAREMLGNCASKLSTNPDMVALVNRDASADGVAAAPTLGRGLGSKGPVPILLVGSRLPSEVGDYLAGTPEYRSGHGDTHMSVLAIGGTDVVSRAVMAQAVAAARTTAGLTATIRVRVDPLTGKYETHTTGGVEGGVFTVTFSDAVARPAAGETVRGTVLDPTMYRINGRRIAGYTSGGTSDEPIELVDQIYIADRTVTVKLSHILEPGDTITVLGGARVGAGGDLRRLERASLTLAKLTADTDRYAPTVDILAVAGMSEFKVFITEPNLIHNELTGNQWSKYIRMIGKGGRALGISTPPTAVTAPLGRHTATEAVLVTTTVPLVAGDSIIVERKATLDKRGIGNSLRRLIVADPKGPSKFEIAGVFVGNQLNNIHQASATITTASPDPVAKMRVTARATGSAAGANGNGWKVHGIDNRPGNTAVAKAASTNAFGIEVIVDATSQGIYYVISERTPVRDIKRVANLLDLASALHNNRTFSSNFVVDYVRASDGITKANPADTKATPLGATASDSIPFSGGISAVAALVKFNDAVQSLTSTDGTYDIVTDLAQSDTTGYTSATQFAPLSDELFITYWASNPEALPKRSSFRIIHEGRATNYHNTEGTPSAYKALSSLRADSSLKPEARTTTQVDELVTQLFP